MYRKIEKRILEEQIEVNQKLKGLTRQSAHKFAKDNLDKAIATAKKTIRYNIGPLGSLFLNDPRYESRLEYLRSKYRVSDADIHSWWDLDEVERVVFAQNDDLDIMAFYLSCVSRGINKEDINEEIWRALPIYDHSFIYDKVNILPLYGIPDLSNMSPSAKAEPLPPEIDNRVVEYCYGREVESIQPYQTYNDWIRSLIDNGEL